MASLTLESELLSLLGGDDKARVMARYCGFDGFGGTTLQAAGAEFGITAERVRQILGEVVKRMADAHPPAPALERTLRFIAERMPAWADEIEPKLLSNGLSARAFRIEGVIRAAELLGRKPPFTITETPKARLVHALSPQALEAVLRVARRAIERHGVTTVNAVGADLLGVAPEAADSRIITTVLAGAEEFRWLDRSSEWFWLPGVPRNPVVRRIRKILSVANPVRFAELCVGIAREYRLQSFAPPAAILLELCRQVAGVQAEGDQIRADPKIDPHRVLSEVEEAIVNVLLTEGGVMRRAHLASLCLERGLNRSSFYSSLSHSPVIVPHGANLLGVIGTEMASGSAPNASPKRRSKYLHAKARAHAISLHRLMQ